MYVNTLLLKLQMEKKMATLYIHTCVCEFLLVTFIIKHQQQHPHLPSSHHLIIRNATINLHTFDDGVFKCHLHTNTYTLV